MPQSKAEQVPWTFINYTTAKANARLMYNNDYVTSGLITGTEWDVILNTMISKLGMTLANMTNSGTWGNYNNDSLTFGGTYSVYISGTQYQYPFGNTSVTGWNLYKTGESVSTMKYGISDIAGNLWEWTEEAALLESSDQYRVLRGGGFDNASPMNSACYRNGDLISPNTHFNVGFRVVLYMK